MGRGWVACLPACPATAPMAHALTWFMAESMSTRAASTSTRRDSSALQVTPGYESGWGSRVEG